MDTVRCPRDRAQSAAIRPTPSSAVVVSAPASVALTRCRYAGQDAASSSSRRPAIRAASLVSLRPRGCGDAEPDDRRDFSCRPALRSCCRGGGAVSACPLDPQRTALSGLTVAESAAGRPRGPTSTASSPPTAPQVGPRAAPGEAPPSRRSAGWSNLVVACIRHQRRPASERRRGVRGDYPVASPEEVTLRPLAPGRQGARPLRARLCGRSVLAAGRLEHLGHAPQRSCPPPVPRVHTISNARRQSGSA